MNRRVERDERTSPFFVACPSYLFGLQITHIFCETPFFLLSLQVESAATLSPFRFSCPFSPSSLFPARAWGFPMSTPPPPSGWRALASELKLVSVCSFYLGANFSLAIIPFIALLAIRGLLLAKLLLSLSLLDFLLPLRVGEGRPPRRKALPERARAHTHTFTHACALTRSRTHVHTHTQTTKSQSSLSSETHFPR